MSNLKKVIADIEHVLKDFLSESTVRLEPISPLSFKINGNFISKAINNIRYNREEINVIKWFDNFWFYFFINFIQKEDSEVDIFLSLSVFQGREDDNIKTQLFRAEWDNYEDNFIHPQPHWHICSPNKEQKQIENFNKFMEDNKEFGFKEFVEIDDIEIINLSDFHFAMSGGWIDNKGHINKITNPNLLRFWLAGILRHIKEQITYIMK